MKISVACCTYNGERFLDAQLQSLVAQSRRPDEIVIVDDCSTDGSATIIDAFVAAAAPRVRVVHVRNETTLGVVKNFEKAIALTSGDVIFLSDQDDVWHPEKVATLSERFDRDRSLDYLFTDARLVDERGTPLGHSLFVALEFNAREKRLVREGSSFAALLSRNLATGATVALRRAVFERAVPFPEEWVHDEWLALMAAAAGRVDYLDQPLIDYRQHGANQIGMRKLALSDKLVKLFQPRAMRYARMQRRTEVLFAKLVALDSSIPADRAPLVASKLDHVRVRRALPARRWARVIPILRELGTGRYASFSSGMRGVLRDFTEPD